MTTMTPAQLLDVLGPQRAGSEGRTDPRLGPCLDALVEALIGELRVIREVDGILGGPVPSREDPPAGATAAPDDPNYDRGAAEFLRKLYESWAARTGELVERARGLHPSGTVVRRLDELSHEHGRVMAMLSVTLDNLFEALEQARRGKGMTLGEVRELLARDHA